MSTSQVTSAGLGVNHGRIQQVQTQPSQSDVTIGTMDDLQSPKMGLLALIFLTSAKMTVYNDTIATLDVDTSNSGDMHNNFPKTTINPNGFDEQDIAVSWISPLQSWFSTTFNKGHEIRTDLGSGAYKADVSPRYFEDGTVASMMSPLIGAKWQLDYFVGSGELFPIVNGFIQANLPAILNYVNTVGVSKTYGPISIKLSKISMDPKDLVCAYAAITNVTPVSADIHTIIRANKTTSFTGSFDLPGHHVNDLSASLTDIAIMVRARVSLPDLSIQVQEVKFSIGEYNLPAELWVLIVAIIAFSAIVSTPIGAALASAGSARGVAGILNDTANPAILNAIGNAINNAISKIKGKIPGNLGESFNGPNQIFSAINAAYSDGGFSTWMSSPDIQGKTLQNIHLPGSHDSGAYGLTKTLPRTKEAGGFGIKYNDIKFLWALRPDTAPSNGKLPFSHEITESTPLHIGEAAYKFVIDTVTLGVSQAGDQNIFQQLQDGIRWFDLRIYLDNDGNFYMQHGLRGPLYKDILEQVKRFIDTYPDSKELIFLNLSHEDFSGDPLALKEVAKLCSDIIPNKNILYKPDDTDKQSFDFQSLASQTVSSLTQSHTRVMFMGNGMNYSFPITNTTGFGGEGQALWNKNWCQTPQTPDIIWYIIGRLRGITGLHLQALAKHKNGILERELKTPAARKANVISVDWYQCSDGKLPVPQIIGLNRSEDAGLN